VAEGPGARRAALTAAITALPNKEDYGGRRRANSSKILPLNKAVSEVASSRPFKTSTGGSALKELHFDEDELAVEALEFAEERITMHSSRQHNRRRLSGWLRRKKIPLVAILPTGGEKSLVSAEAAADVSGRGELDWMVIDECHYGYPAGEYRRKVRELVLLRNMGCLLWNIATVQTSETRILVQLRSKHSPLNEYLRHIGVRDP
jgi:hypothetical protein